MKSDFLQNCPERKGLVSGQIGENLPVQLEVTSVETPDQIVIVNPMFLGACIDALNPLLSEVPPLKLSPNILKLELSVNPGNHDSWAVFLAIVEALGQLKELSLGHICH